MNWKSLFPGLWAYKPLEAAFRTGRDYRLATGEHATAAAAEAVSRSFDQPHANGIPLFVSPDPGGIMWAMTSMKRKRILWKTWLKSQWDAEYSKVDSASKPLIQAGEATEAEFRKIPAFVPGIGVVVAVAILGVLAYAAKK